MKWLKVLSVLTIVCTGTVFFTSHKCEMQVPAAEIEVQTQIGPIQKVAKMSAVTMELFDTYYETLSEKDKAIYDAILTSAKVYAETSSNEFIETSVDFSDYTQDDLLAIGRKVMYDHPAYAAFWAGTLTISGHTAIKIHTTDTPDVMIPDEQYKELLETWSHNAMNKENIARIVLQTLCNHVKYDEAEGTNPHWNDDVAVLNHKLSCCQGIAFTYKRFMDAAGIPCVNVTCYTNDGTYHMINAIKLDDKWTFVDPTSAAGHLDRTLDFFQMNQEILNTVATELVYVPEV